MGTGLFSVIIYPMSGVVESPVGNLGQCDLFLFHVYSRLLLPCRMSWDPGPVDPSASTALKSGVLLCVSGMGWAWGSAGSPSSLGGWGSQGWPGRHPVKSKRKRKTASEGFLLRLAAVLPVCPGTPGTPWGSLSESSRPTLFSYLRFSKTLRTAV